MRASRRDFLNRLWGAALLAPLAVRGRTKGTVLGEFFVAGFRYHDGPQVIERIRPHDVLALEPEPTNAHDAYAIRVFWRDRSVGYLPRVENRVINRILESGTPVRAEVAAVDRGAEPWQTLRMRVVAPTIAT